MRLKRPSTEDFPSLLAAFLLSKELQLGEESAIVLVAFDAAALVVVVVASVAVVLAVAGVLVVAVGELGVALAMYKPWFASRKACSERHVDSTVWVLLCFGDVFVAFAWLVGAGVAVVPHIFSLFLLGMPCSMHGVFLRSWGTWVLFSVPPCASLSICRSHAGQSRLHIWLWTCKLLCGARTSDS